MKLLIIANPNAGRGRCVRLLPKIQTLIESAGHEVHSVLSQDAGDLTALARAGVRRGVDALVACGGDGTVHAVLQALVSTPVALGIIPAGTGNDAAANLAIPASYQAACGVLLRARTRMIDLARVTAGPGDPAPTYYLNVAGAGFDAQVNRRVNRNASWLRGRAAYISTALGTLSKFKPRPMDIQYDKRRFTGDVMLVAVGNGRSYGGGLKILPQAEMDDGWLDLCIVKRTSKFELLRNIPRLYKGAHTDHPAIDIHRARRVILSSADRVELFGDGEYLQDLPAVIDVAPRAIRILAPSDSAV